MLKLKFEIVFESTNLSYGVEYDTFEDAVRELEHLVEDFPDKYYIRVNPVVTKEK